MGQSVKKVDVCFNFNVGGSYLGWPIFKSSLSDVVVFLVPRVKNSTSSGDYWALKYFPQNNTFLPSIFSINPYFLLVITLQSPPPPPSNFDVRFFLNFYTNNVSNGKRRDCLSVHLLHFNLIQWKFPENYSIFLKIFKNSPVT